MIVEGFETDFLTRSWSQREKEDTATGEAKATRREAAAKAHPVKFQSGSRRRRQHGEGEEIVCAARKNELGG